VPLYTYTSIDDPAGVHLTEAFGINNAGQIVGDYEDSGSKLHGFLYNGGTYTTLAGAALGINNSGQIVGYVQDSSGEHGFLYNSGFLSVFDDPQGVYGKTVAQGINDLGYIVGSYYDAANDVHLHGFLTGDGVHYTTIDAGFGSEVLGTSYNASKGLIYNVGYYYANQYDIYTHGFINDFFSHITITIDDPLGISTKAEGINSAGQVVGTFQDGVGHSHGFLYNGGTYTTLDNPLGTDTHLHGINDAGQIVGNYQDASGNSHGFVGQANTGLLSALSLDQQTELIYIGYFNRSADGGGFSFWEGQDAHAQASASSGGLGQSAEVALTNIANSFTPQPETIALYPFLSNPHPNYSDPAVQAGLGTFIGNVYGNLFGHAADSGGLAYWTGQIETGAVGLGAAVLAIANGAQGSDVILLSNKIAVALDFTNLTSAANVPVTATFLAEARTVLAGVDGIFLTDASVTAAEALIAPWIASHPHGMSVGLVGSTAAPAYLELT
jgi:probable HAF family extracellular repeat protein